MLFLVTNLIGLIGYVHVYIWLMQKKILTPRKHVYYMTACINIKQVQLLILYLRVGK